MKVRKTEWVETEVTVEVTAEDIVEAIAESTDSASLVKRGINNCYTFLRGISDEAIAEMNPAVKKTIHEAMLAQVNRFAPSNV
jgi:hypothetical protein